MEWKYTKEYTKHFVALFASLFGIGVALVTTLGGKMVDYYCSADSPAFLGFHFTGSPYCSIEIAFIFVLLMTIGLLTVMLIGATLLDIGIGTFRFLKRRLSYLKQVRSAKITTVAVCVEHEYFIAVRNDEFWFRADKVVANSKFIFDNKRFNRDIRWSDSTSSNRFTSIPRKKHKILHFATIDNSKLTIHMIGGDEIFPFPNKENSYYVFPLYITGEMLFMGHKTKQVNLTAGSGIYIYNNGEIKVE